MNPVNSPHSPSQICLLKVSFNIILPGAPKFLQYFQVHVCPYSSLFEVLCTFLKTDLYQKLEYVTVECQSELIFLNLLKPSGYFTYHQV